MIEFFERKKKREEKKKRKHVGVMAYQGVP